jgi:hypothetical protein
MLFKAKLDAKGQGGIAIIPRRSPKFGLFFDLESRAASEEFGDGQDCNESE